jgi:hypothetical protein
MKISKIGELLPTNWSTVPAVVETYTLK